MTAEEFQNACDNWLTEYNDRVHGALGMQSPNSRWESARYFCPPADLRHLDRLLAFVGERKVGKDGISYEGGKYIAGDLLPGNKVQVSIDASEMGVIYVFDMQGHFICNAYDDSLKGLDRQKIAAEAKRTQQAQIATARKEVQYARSESNFKKVQKAEVARRVSGKVVDLPTPPVGHPSQEGISEKVVSIHKPKTATPEQLFERAWELFSNGGEMVMSEQDCDRVWYGVDRGDCGAILNSRADRAGRKAFLSWLGEYSPAAQREA